MTLEKAAFVAASLQSLRPDIWTMFSVEQDGNADDAYMVKRIRFCMVEVVAK